MSEMRRSATLRWATIVPVLAWVAVLWSSHCTGSAAASAWEAVPIADRLQLFLDDWLIESMHDLELRLHSPQPAEIVLRKDKPWEDDVMYDPVVIKDGPRYRMWYRTNFQAPPFYTGYAESKDGVQWVKPSLGLIDFNGSKDNNLVWSSGSDKRSGYVLSVFKDTNPKAAEDERYKAIGVTEGCKAVLGLLSSDGLRWRPLGGQPIIRGPEGDSLFDSHNIAFWDAPRSQYVAYVRGWPTGCPAGIRSIRRTVSTDFRNWSPLEYLDLGSSPPEHLYKNAATPYYRRPDILLMFPKRFLENRQADPDWAHKGLSDIVFMSSRDGLCWDRRFMEAFMRPGPDPLNWHERAIEVGQGLVPTKDGRMSLYYIEHYRTDSVHIRRGVLRVDGLVSVHARYAAGELVTRPLVFEGRRLEINYASSAAGSVRIGIEEPSGQPITGYAVGECEEIFGDELCRVPSWAGNSDVSGLAGRPVRLRIHLQDADLYSFRFR